MDDMENQALPPEPENMDAPPAQQDDIPAVTETVPEEVPAVQPAAREMPPAPQPRRRSPYENSPYMMPNQTARPVPSPPVQPPVNTEKPKKKRKGHPVRNTILVILLLALSISVTAAVVGHYLQDQTALKFQALEARIDVLQEQLNAGENAAAGESISGTPNVSPAGLTPAQVYAQNQKSVVLIETDVATGSGFILSEDGYVVTNYHVVEDGAAITVVMHDQSHHDAALVGYEANNDVALLKIEGEGFPAVTLGSSDDLIVGDQVAAIGNPLGELTSTLTVGFVSAKERDVYTDTTTINMLQTDCAINSGNSGGPLFNMKGEVVGITTAKYSGMSSSGASIEGIGFAVPMDDVVGIFDDLKEFGYVKSGYLGIGVYSMDPAEAAMFNLPMGCLVDSVTPGSCADVAGLEASDIIIALGGYEIDSYTDLSRALRRFDGGETTTITVYRSGQELTFSITLDERPHEEAPQSGNAPMPDAGSYEEWYKYFFGE